MGEAQAAAWVNRSALAKPLAWAAIYVRLLQPWPNHYDNDALETAKGWHDDVADTTVDNATQLQWRHPLGGSRYCCQAQSAMHARPASLGGPSAWPNPVILKPFIASVMYHLD